MNKFSQWIITIGVIVIAIFNVLSYLKIIQVSKTIDYMGNYQLVSIDTRLQFANGKLADLKRSYY